MADTSLTKKQAALLALAENIRSQEDWWRFPTENLVQGFMGTDQIFIVGDQPSTDEWGPTHPNRRAFYDTLQKVGLQNAHLTDLYKKRGLSGELKWKLPDDFSYHLDLFQKEIEILKPTLIVALGELAQRLLIENLKEWKISIPRIWHFSHVVRAGKESEYENNMREIIFGKP
jgi:hypothetical protein